MDKGTPKDFFPTFFPEKVGNHRHIAVPLSIPLHKALNYFSSFLAMSSLRIFVNVVMDMDLRRCLPSTTGMSNFL